MHRLRNGSREIPKTNVKKAHVARLEFLQTTLKRDAQTLSMATYSGSSSQSLLRRLVIHAEFGGNNHLVMILACVHPTCCLELRRNF